MGLCKLCKKKESIKNSHLIPKFTTDWIRNTSDTGKFRTSVLPNKRVQDSKKVDLLCGDCENLFSKFEGYFSKVIFKPVMNSNNPVVDYPVVDYTESLLKFAVSLSWRILVFKMYGYPWKILDHKLAAQKAEIRWREYLLNNTEMKDEHHILMLGFVEDAPEIEGTDIDMNFYFRRSVDADIAQGSKESFVYTKLPGFVFISPIFPGTHTHMVDTLIGENGTLEFYKQAIDSTIIKFLVRRFNQTLSPIRTISERQWAKIEADYSKNIDKIQDSDVFKLFLMKEQKKNRLNSE
ncbi:hypothetical protein HQ587_03530 [bacterium]|nr:hypothetical protein [bacterium]